MAHTQRKSWTCSVLMASDKAESKSEGCCSVASHSKCWRLWPQHRTHLETRGSSSRLSGSLFSKCLPLLRLGQAQVRSLKLWVCSSWVGRDPNAWAIQMEYLSICISIQMEYITSISIQMEYITSTSIQMEYITNVVNKILMPVSHSWSAFPKPWIYGSCQEHDVYYWAPRNVALSTQCVSREMFLTQQLVLFETAWDSLLSVGAGVVTLSESHHQY